VDVIRYCESRSYTEFTPVYADPDTRYSIEYSLRLEEFEPVVSLPGQPHDVVPVREVRGTKIDSVFIGSCTNGRMEDMRDAAGILRGKKVAPGVVLKIVPATDEIWKSCLREGLITVFKEAGALVGNAGCAGCASGQIGQNGPGEKTVSTGNRNFEGKQGKGDVYLASVATAAASAVAGHITTADNIPDKPSLYPAGNLSLKPVTAGKPKGGNLSTVIEGKVWLVLQDNIDTDMIYHNRYLAITDPKDMGSHAFSNLKDWEDYPRRTEPGDIIITGRNFGSGSSRQQAVDCFRSLQNQAILARSFGSIYERNAINAGFPVLVYDNLDELDLSDRDTVQVDLAKGILTNKKNGRHVQISSFSEIQMKIYQSGDVLKL
jgi:3-isopropylmalate/(R)-2-methylmalate dehydratase large subunit